MGRKHIGTANQYEKAIREFAKLHTGDTSATSGRLDELSERIEDFESRTWTEDMFHSLTGEYS